MQYTLEDVVRDAQEIEALANSEYASDWELSVRSEKFFAKWGLNWTSILNRLKCER